METSNSFPKYKAAIALLTYNNRNLLADFLEDIIESIPKDQSVGLFVIDNASTDDTQEFLKPYIDKLHLITIKVNKGFTNGYEEGLSQINAEIYCLLSSDVQISKGWIEPVLNLFESDSKIAVVQPKIKSFFQRDEFEYAGACGGFIDTLAFPFCRGRMFYENEKDHGQYDDEIEIFWASGACFFIRSCLYKESGGLDNDFYAHMEEIDLCWRLKNRGFKIMVCPSSEVYHMGGQVIEYGSPEKTYRNHRNNLIMMLKNLPASEAVWKITFRLVLDFLAFANMIARGQVKASFSIIHAHWNFLYYLRRWLKKREELNSWIVGYASSGIYPKSIVWAYFLKGKKRFSDLNWK